MSNPLTADDARAIANRAMHDKCVDILSDIHIRAQHGKWSCTKTITNEQAGYLSALGYAVYRVDVTDEESVISWEVPQ